MFLQKAPESGLFEAYQKVMTKLVMAQYAQQNQSQGAGQATSSQSTAARRPSVREFLNQYRTAYEEICRDPSRVRAKAAYERVFDVANQTDDMLEAQLLLEQGNLLFGLSKFDSVEIFENRLKDMDPLFFSTTAQLLNSLDAARRATSPETMYYFSAKAEVQTIFDTVDFRAKMLYTVNLALALTEYCNLKRDFYLQKNERQQKEYVLAIEKKKKHIQALLKWGEDVLNMTLEDLMSEECYKIWFLNPAVKDDGKALGKVRTVMHPQNLLVFLDIVANEIRPDLSVAEILIRRPERVLWYLPN